MASAAHRDYATRLGEVRFLIRSARRTANLAHAAALSKAATILAAAALERYINAVIIEACSQLKVATWNDLTEGQQRYMARQMAHVAYLPVRRIHRRGDVVQKQRSRLRAAITQCMAAFGSPATWPHVPEYGLFMDGAAEPKKVDGTLRSFHAANEGIFDFCQSRGRDRKALATALQALIDARHQAAHALEGTPPSANDVRHWISLSFIFTRQIEAYLGFA